MKTNFKPRITLFQCCNILSKDAFCKLEKKIDFDLDVVELPCSSLVKDVFLLRAFESGSDAVVVLVCPEGTCRYVEGNIRAKKRVQWVKNLLDEIGLDGKRLSLFNVAHSDKEAAVKIIENTLSDLSDLGPSPARSVRETEAVEEKKV